MQRVFGLLPSEEVAKKKGWGSSRGGIEVYLSNEVIAALAGTVVGAILSPVGSWLLD